MAYLNHTFAIFSLPYLRKFSEAFLSPLKVIFEANHKIGYLDAAQWVPFRITMTLYARHRNKLFFVRNWRCYAACGATSWTLPNSDNAVCRLLSLFHAGDNNSGKFFEAALYNTTMLSFIRYKHHQLPDYRRNFKRLWEEWLYSETFVENLSRSNWVIDDHNEQKKALLYCSSNLL